MAHVFVCKLPIALEIGGVQTEIQQLANVVWTEVGSIVKGVVLLPSFRYNFHCFHNWDEFKQ